MLASLADRRSPRTVVVGCGLVRALLIGLTAIPAEPLGVLCSLVFLTALVDAPGGAACLAAPPGAASCAGYLADMAADLLAGRPAPRPAPRWAGWPRPSWAPGPTLVLGAASLLSSAALSAAAFRLLGVRRRAVSDGHLPGRWAYPGGRARARSLHATYGRGPAGLGWPVALLAAPAALAAPFAASLGAGATAVGALMAAVPAGGMVGGMVGGWLLARADGAPRPARRVAWPAALSTLPLAVVALHPDLVASLLLWPLCGACSASLIAAGTAAPPARPEEPGRLRADPR